MDEDASEDGGVLLSLLNITATVTTILMFLTGVTPCREVQTVLVGRAVVRVRSVDAKSLENFVICQNSGFDLPYTNNSPS